MRFLENYLPIIKNYLSENKLIQEPTSLYEPMDYLLELGGKKIRPILTLMGCDIFNGDINMAVKPALGIEYFHNFSLMHDDIMDQAVLRRNKETVHVKYNVNTAILSGDALLIKSYQMLEGLESELFKKCSVLFSRTAIQLCEGQQYDIIFETLNDVSFDDYILMITGKTAVLCGCALQMGALIANASDDDGHNLYEFGKYLGIAFQLRDDYLDVFGTQELIGKKQSGDIYENKKTILYISAMEKATPQLKKELEYWYSIREETQEKADRVYDIFKELQVDEICKKNITSYHNKAMEYLNKINIPEEKKSYLYELMDYLLERQQ